MGCSDCGRKGGCDDRKGTQRTLLGEAIARLYPGAPEWGRPDDEARFGAGVSRAEAMRLQRAISAALAAPTFLRPGDGDDLCDFVYVLCVGRQPALVEALVEGLGGAAIDRVGGERIAERYLRVALSSVARMAAVQEVEMVLDGELLREAPRAGVFDPILLKRMQKLVALLEASDVAHIDFGLLDRPLDGARPGSYRDRFGAEPSVCSFLFFAQPPTTASLIPIADF